MNARVLVNQHGLGVPCRVVRTVARELSRKGHEALGRSSAPDICVCLRDGTKDEVKRDRQKGAKKKGVKTDEK